MDSGGDVKGIIEPWEELGLAQRYPYTRWIQKRRISHFDIVLPKKPKKEEVENHHLPKAKQRFVPPDAQMVRSVDRKLLAKQAADIDKIPLRDEERLTDEEKDFIKQEWHRRLNGYWFFNNGFLEYVTGIHYFYIAYYKIPIRKKGASKKVSGLPSFCDSDRDMFYIWDHVEQDSTSYGLYLVTNRRDGKSFKGLCIQYEYASRHEDVVCGIQSKTYADAGKLFKKLVKSWMKMAVMFRPSDTGDSNPNKTLSFNQPSRRTTTSLKRYDEVLGSEINYENSKEEAYDGSDLARKLDDEVGKTVDADINERWNINKYCFGDGISITGKNFSTTTVEEMEKKGGKNAKTLWDRSNPKKKNETTGQTDSGLSRWFKPAYYGLRGETTKYSFVDDYGYSDCRGARDYILHGREGKSGVNLAGEKRKYPIDEKECWTANHKRLQFDSESIFIQKEHNETLPHHMIEHGRFMWEIPYVSARFVPNHNKLEKGPWQVVSFPPKEDRNKSIITRSGRGPGNTTFGASGVDPYDHEFTTGGKKSLGSMSVLKRYNPLMPHDGNYFAAMYLDRPKGSPILAYDQWLMAAVFYGIQILAENNKVGFINHAKAVGLKKYLMPRPDFTHTKSSKKQQEYGIPMSGFEARNGLVGALDEFIYMNVGFLDPSIVGEGDGQSVSRNYITDMIDQWEEFDWENWNELDAFVSSGLGCIAVKAKIPKAVNKSRFGKGDLFRKYDNSGALAKQM